jgi:hypothetical protein
VPGYVSLPGTWLYHAPQGTCMSAGVSAWVFGDSRTRTLEGKRKRERECVCVEREQNKAKWTRTNESNYTKTTRVR